MDSKINKGSFAYGVSTVAFGTVITRLIPPRDRRLTKITSLRYRCGSTINDLTLMRPLNSTTVVSAVAEAGTAVTILANPGVTGNAAATGDWVVLPLVDGRYHLSLITLSALAITLTTAIPANSGGVVAGAKLWWFGLPADTGHVVLTPAASTTNIYSDPEAGIFQAGLPKEEFDNQIYGNRSGYDDPLVLHCPNATAQCWIDHVAGVYSAIR